MLNPCLPFYSSSEREKELRKTGFAFGCFVTLLLCCSAWSQTADWRYYGGSAASTKFAPHTQIDRDNFADLRIIWRWRPPDQRILAANPDLQTN